MNTQINLDASIQDDAIQKNEQTYRNILLSKAICDTFGNEQASV
jgi:hypothetical protein